MPAMWRYLSDALSRSYLFEPNGFDRIVRAIRVESPRLPGEPPSAPETDLPKGLREPAQQPTDPDFGPNPYQGLSAFTEKEADRFFGREQLTQDLWKVFRSLHNPHLGERSALRLLPILGPSGCGEMIGSPCGIDPRARAPALARAPVAAGRRHRESRDEARRAPSLGISPHRHQSCVSRR